MMQPVIRVNGKGADACAGRVRLDFFKTVWNGGFIALASLAPIFWSWSAIIVFIGLTYFTMLFGHSIGMHRMMIHRSLKARKPFNYILVYLGVLVGMGGPSRIIAVHDLRDWAQRLSDCHDYFSHRTSYIRDITWQLFYRFEFEKPPKIEIEKEIANDPFFRLLDKTWPIHVALFGGLLFWLGGMPWLVWGLGLRCALGVIGHWTITYFCHNPGPASWRVKEAGVQASDLPLMALITHGECWHSNHHAFPESAQIGLAKGQWDPAWWVILSMEKIGLAYDVKRPRPDHLRDDLEKVAA